MKKIKRIIFFAAIILVTIFFITTVYSWLFFPNSSVKIDNLSMLHDLNKCNADFDLVNDGDSGVLVEVVIFEPHFILDKEKVIHKSEFYIPAYTTQNNTMRFFFSPCSQSYTNIRINLLDEG